MGLVNEKQGILIKEIAEKEGIDTSLFQVAYEARIKELDEDRKLSHYYATKGIDQGDEPICIDPSALSFPDHPQEEASLKESTFDFIKKINKEISESSSAKSIKSRRCISSYAHRRVFRGIQDKYGSNAPFFLRCIAEKLEQLGAIYGLNWEGSFLHSIQA